MISANEIAESLKGRRSGPGWTCKCPAHDDKIPSLSVSDTDDGRVLVYCHAGCEQEAVLYALRRLGLWNRSMKHYHYRRIDKQRENRDRYRDLEANEQQRIHRAREIWRSTRPATGTEVETYLRSRGITIPPPPSLRFAVLRHRPSGRTLPAMVAAVTHHRVQHPVAVHRTFLCADGSDKAPINPSKMALGLIGGGAVRLAEAGHTLVVAEGIETALSVLMVTGLPTWAGLSVGGLRTLVLPPLPIAGEVIIAADHDEPGLRAAVAAAEHWHHEGRRVRIALPPLGFDFNDLAQAEETLAGLAGLAASMS